MFVVVPSLHGFRPKFCMSLLSPSDFFVHEIKITVQLKAHSCYTNGDDRLRTPLPMAQCVISARKKEKCRMKTSIINCYLNLNV
jgi:hypothetical protein